MKSIEGLFIPHWIQGTTVWFRDEPPSWSWWFSLIVLSSSVTPRHCPNARRAYGDWGVLMWRLASTVGSLVTEIDLMSPAPVPPLRARSVCVEHLSHCAGGLWTLSPASLWGVSGSYLKPLWGFITPHFPWLQALWELP